MADSKTSALPAAADLGDGSNGEYFAAIQSGANVKYNFSDLPGKALYVASSTSHNKYKQQATWICSSTNAGATVNALTGSVPIGGTPNFSPLTAPIPLNIIYLPGIYKIGAAAILARTGHSHTTAGGLGSVFIQSTTARCRGSFMLYDGNVHSFTIDGFWFDGNNASGVSGAETYPGMGFGIWIDHRNGANVDFIADHTAAGGTGSPSAAGFSSSNYTGRSGLLQGSAGGTPTTDGENNSGSSGKGGCSYDWNGSAYQASISVDTLSFANIVNLRGSHFQNAKWSSTLSNYRGFVKLANDSGIGDIQAAHDYHISNISGSGCADGIAFDIQEMPDGHISDFNIGDGSTIFRCNSGTWRATNMKAWFAAPNTIQTTGYGFDLGGTSFTGSCMSAQDCNGPGYSIGASNITLSGTESDTNVIGYDFTSSSSRATVTGAHAFNRATGGYNSSGTTQTIAFQIANNRTGMLIYGNCAEASPVATGNTHGAVNLIGATAPKGDIRILDPGATKIHTWGPSGTYVAIT